MHRHRLDVWGYAVFILIMFAGSGRTPASRIVVKAHLRLSISLLLLMFMIRGYVRVAAKVL